MGLLDPPAQLPSPRFTAMHAFGNSYVQGAGSDGGTISGGGGFVGKVAEQLGLVDSQLANHAIGGSAMGLDQGVGNCGYSSVLAVFGRQDITATMTAATAGPYAWADASLTPNAVSVPVLAQLTSWPVAGRFEVQGALGKYYRYPTLDTTPRFVAYDVDVALPASSVLVRRATKKQTKRWGQWPVGEHRLVVLGPTHDWLGVTGANDAHIAGFRVAICRALAANIIAGDGDSFNGGTGLTASAVTPSGLLAGSGANWYAPGATGSFMEVTHPADAGGCPLVFGWTLKQGQSATWRITINGTTYADVPLVSTSVTNRYTGNAFRIPAADVHPGDVVRATATSISTAFAGPIDYVSVEARTPTTPVIVMGTGRYPGNAGANDADVVDVNTRLRALVASFAQADGRNHVRFVDTDAILANSAPNFYTDNQHPSERGHSLLRDGVMREIRAWQRSFSR